ncbi:jg11749 [Pararge aegeria aegeria]|uniref:Jg11749 protein n=1 Tax=Pararge aegeria aegeria TaxID=348720 RepID=A0A8S4S054_9NEOP|nr:jg11749 [Pararge aegeria aegeria]
MHFEYLIVKRTKRTDKRGGKFEVLGFKLGPPDNETDVLTTGLSPKIMVKPPKSRENNNDPYVKVWLQFGDKRIEKRKTAVFKCTLNPVFNDSFSFNVPWEKIRECSLDVQVMDFDNIGRNELIGRILLAGKNGSGATETKHWQDMITKPRQTIVQWHRLKPE